MQGATTVADSPVPEAVARIADERPHQQCRKRQVRHAQGPPISLHIDNGKALKVAVEHSVDEPDVDVFIARTMGSVKVMEKGRTRVIPTISPPVISPCWISEWERRFWLPVSRRSRWARRRRMLLVDV